MGNTISIMSSSSIAKLPANGTFIYRKNKYCNTVLHPVLFTILTKILLVCLSLLLLIGCSSFYEDEFGEIEIRSDRYITVKSPIDTMNIYQEGLLAYKRSSKCLTLNVSDGTKEYELKISPVLSDKFLLGNLVGFGFFHVYDLLFCNFDNLFTYRSPIYLEFDSNNVEAFSYGFPSENIGKVSFLVSIPEGNHFCYNGPEGYKSKFGFLLAGAGLEFYISKNEYLSLYADLKLDFFLPFPAAADFIGEHEFISNYVLSCMFYKDYDWIHLGIGPAFSGFINKKVNTDTVFPDYQEKTIFFKTYNTLALSFAVKKPITKFFSLGLFYTPSFLRMGEITKFEYSHILNFSLLFNINLTNN